MTLSPSTQRLEPPGGSLATRGYDPEESLFSISVYLAFWWCECDCAICVVLCSLTCVNVRYQFVHVFECMVIYFSVDVSAAVVVNAQKT